VLNGRTSTGSARWLRGYIARIAKIPVVALDNEFIAQPSFLYEAARLPLLLAELRQEGLLIGA
jgi:hypothetical protein